MITPCKMRLPEKDREEISRRVQECCFANGYKSYQNDTEVRTLQVRAIFIDKTVFRATSFTDERAIDLPEIDPLDFLKKYEHKDGHMEGCTASLTNQELMLKRDKEGMELTYREPPKHETEYDPTVKPKTMDIQDLINHRRSKVLHLLSARQTFGNQGAIPDVKRIICIDERPMSHRMGWEAE